jgi:arylsulfatase A-like enzyme
MVIRGPGPEPKRRGRPRRSHALTANVDVPATILDAARVKPPLPLDGRSLLDRSHRRRALLIERLAEPGPFTQIKTASNWTYWEGEGRWEQPHLL